MKLLKNIKNCISHSEFWISSCDDHFICCYCLTAYEIYPFVCYYTAWIWLAKQPKYLVPSFVSKDKFRLTDSFIGFLLLCYITITTTNITDAIHYTLYTTGTLQYTIPQIRKKYDAELL